MHRMQRDNGSATVGQSHFVLVLATRAAMEDGWNGKRTQKPTLAPRSVNVKGSENEARERFPGEKKDGSVASYSFATLSDRKINDER
ncbi:sodium channel protein type 1 subunit alpha-like protein [Anopheles sinensis]|uniref:Sodium channel protein type 1 subunit alpha-like protein n=1 Tax=Anopheles sinensis TaxID=74873 RepID=A0A084VNP8_ANOSI|nr:sodium channel protein type 1 subunit alpha-like protein [Anopheles sinensis]